jgi:hypothetical protein
VALLLSVPAWAAGPALNNFSADVVTTTQGGTATAKIYIKNGKKRIEMTSNGSPSVMIIRPDKKVIWMISPETKTYRAVPMRNRKRSMISDVWDSNEKSERKFVGKETVDGHPTKKYQVIEIIDGKKKPSGYLWEATDMHNFLIKHQTEDGKRTTLCKNIKRGGVADSLFNLPAGYKKIAPPTSAGHRKKIEKKTEKKKEKKK